MARLEAQLQCPDPSSGQSSDVANQLAAALGCKATWLDDHNVALPLVLQPLGLSVQVLLEFQARGGVTLLVNSREGMGHGAPQSRRCFEELLTLLAQQLPGVEVLYRSDRDGPIRQRSQRDSSLCAAA